MQRFRQQFIGKMVVFSIVVFALIGVFFWIVSDNWTMIAVEMTTVSQGKLLPANGVIKQKFTSNMDGIERITIIPHFDNPEHTGEVHFSICDGEEQLWMYVADASQLISDATNEIQIAPYLAEMNGKELELVIDPQGTGMAMWSGTTINTGRFDVDVQTAGLIVNDEAAEGSLVMVAGGHQLIRAAQYIWPVGILLWLLAVAACCKIHKDLEKGKRTGITAAVETFRKYSYLIKQLVVRDFRVKYQSSALGVAWSFLNPMLTMVVYLFVFSTLFRSDIQYFPVYLLSGIVLFNCFSEATNLGLSSIVSNSSLITKVYMPKMIYPLCKVISAFVNLGISLIPLLVMMLIAGMPFSKSILLLPLVIVFLFLLCLGVSLILATMNVFFRDTQFLWSVLVMLLNFLSPIFYPESIIPVSFQTIYHLNPIYQLLYFMRSIIIQGVSPAPISYLYCFLTSIVPLVIGLWIFRKHQDRFVLYL